MPRLPCIQLAWLSLLLIPISTLHTHAQGAHPVVAGFERFFADGSFPTRIRATLPRE